MQAQRVQEGREGLHDHQHAQRGAEEDEEGCGGVGAGCLFGSCTVAARTCTPCRSRMPAKQQCGTAMRRSSRMPTNRHMHPLSSPAAFLTDEDGDGGASAPDRAHEQAVVEHGRQLRQKE